MARRRRKRKQLEEIFGCKLPEIGDDKDAPPIDEEVLRGFVEKRIDKETARRIETLIWKYHSWAVAYCKMLKWGDNVHLDQIR